MIRHPKFIRIAHRKAALSQLLSHLLQEYFVSTTGDPPRQDLICEDVPFADRVVTPEALADVEDYLRQLVDNEDQQLRQFELTERAAVKLPPVKTREEREEPPQEPADDQRDKATAAKPRGPRRPGT